MKTRILFVDDEKPFLNLLKENYKDEYKVFTASSDKEARSVYSDFGPFAAITLDLRLGKDDGFQLLEYFKQVSPLTPVILITAFGTVNSAVEAMKMGAFDYLTKPIKIDELNLVLRRAVEHYFIEKENRKLRSALDRALEKTELLYVSKKMQAVMKKIEEAAKVDFPVLIMGESGVGKELVAKEIHRKSERKYGPYITINCAAIPQNLFESELFGYEKGAFTGAVKAKPSVFELANEGTLFMDEIAEMPIEQQSKLLRVLQESQLFRLGGVVPRKFDARIITATNKDLEREVEDGKFRPDLFYRVDVIRIEIPPLRERMDDIPLLAKHFVRKHSPKFGKKILKVTEDFLEALKEYPWPGNVRELENLILKVLLKDSDGMLDIEDLPSELFKHFHSTRIPLSYKEFLEWKKKEKTKLDYRLTHLFLEKLLERNDMNISRAAREAGIDRRLLQNLLKEHKLR